MQEAQIARVAPAWPFGPPGIRQQALGDLLQAAQPHFRSRDEYVLDDICKSTRLKPDHVQTWADVSQHLGHAWT